MIVLIIIIIKANETTIFLVSVMSRKHFLFLRLLLIYNHDSHEKCMKKTSIDVANTPKYKI